MRILLRNTSTGLYVESSGNWTNRSETALGFEAMGDAVGFARQSELRNMEVVFCSALPGIEESVPLNSLDVSGNKGSENVAFKAESWNWRSHFDGIFRALGSRFAK